MTGPNRCARHGTDLRKSVLAALLISASGLGGCATARPRPPAIAYDDAVVAVKAPEPAKPVEVVTIVTPLPLPGQLKPLEHGAPPSEPTDPKARIGAANTAARIQPAGSGFLNAIQQYPFADGALYQVYSAPGQITDIMLQEGEQLVGTGPIAAGDTVRWIIGDTVSGAGPTLRSHILVKPTRADLATNLVINTDRRTYHLELRATPSTYMASVSWLYPQDRLALLRAQNAAAATSAPAASGVDLSSLNFRYRIEGDNPAWRPLRAMDDGHQVFVEFPAGIGQGEMPPLFVVGPSGAGELVNFRVSGRYIIVDRLFAAAELRLGDKRAEQRVRIVRDDGRIEARGRR